MMATKTKGHTGFRNGDLFCFNCGASYKMNFPQPVDIASAIMIQFDKSHKGCKKTWVQPVASPSLDYSNVAIQKNADWWLTNGERGTSSETMYFYFTGTRVGQNLSHPHDPDDFRRCYLLLKAVPQWKMEMDKLRQGGEIWNKLVDNWDKLTEMLEAAMSSDSKKAPEMYDLMQSLIYPNQKQ